MKTPLSWARRIEAKYSAQEQALLLFTIWCSTFACVLLFRIAEYLWHAN